MTSGLKPKQVQIAFLFFLTMMTIAIMGSAKYDVLLLNPLVTIAGIVAAAFGWFMAAQLNFEYQTKLETLRHANSIKLNDMLAQRAADATRRGLMWRLIELFVTMRPAMTIVSTVNADAIKAMYELAERRFGETDVPQAFDSLKNYKTVGNALFRTRIAVNLQMAMFEQWRDEDAQTTADDRRRHYDERRAYTLENFKDAVESLRSAIEILGDDETLNEIDNALKLAEQSQAHLDRMILRHYGG